VMAIGFDALVFGRVVIGGCLLGYVFSHVFFARERVIFLYSIRARSSEQSQRIHTTELLHLRQYDELTKISNRRTFDETLEVYFERARREETALAILFIDVDFF